MHKAAKIFFNNLFDSASEEYKDKVADFIYHSDYRDSFEKIFDFLFSWSYPGFRRLANTLNKKGLIPSNSSDRYQGDLGFMFKTGMAIFSVSGLFILLSIITR